MQYTINMRKNRLNLNFALSTNAERIEYIEKYLQLPQWKINPPTSDELETIGNYILYGKDKNGKNFVQKKEIQIPTRYGTWDRKEEESYEAILESPSFNENQIFPLDMPSAPKVRRTTFSREEASQNPELKAALEPLWQKIDSLDLLLNCYDLLHGKRKKPIRPELLKKFTPEQITEAHEKAAHLNQYQYLKRRHLLVEYRSEQFSIREAFSDTILNNQLNQIPVEYLSLELNNEIPVYPLGLIEDNPISALAFRPFPETHTRVFTQKELHDLSHFYWKMMGRAKEPFCFDFTNPDHVAELYLNLADLVCQEREKEQPSPLLRTLRFYEEQTFLEDHQRDILKMKTERRKNAEIAEVINQRYSKTYTANYISTIFRQKIVNKICETVLYHAKLLENLCYEENFKKCNSCGRWYLIDPTNFVRKANAADGFASKCKLCDKRDRQRRNKGAKTK